MNPSPDTKQYTKKVPQELWRGLRDNILIPNNEAIVKIIKSNFHLVEGAEMPQHIITFIVHAEVWTRQEKYGMEQREYLNQFGFPADFQEYILETTNQLKAEYNLLVARKRNKSKLRQNTSK